MIDKYEGGNIHAVTGVERGQKIPSQQGKIEVPALRIDLTVEKGDLPSGPSGSGKTTLLNIIGCLDKSTVTGLDLTAGNRTLSKKDLAC